MKDDGILKIILGSAILLLIVVMIVTPILDNVTYTQTADNSPTGYATSNIQSGTYTISNGQLLFNDTEVVTINTQDWAIISDSLSVIAGSGGNSFDLTDYKNKIAKRITSLDVDATAMTWTETGGSISGDLGNNCKVRSSTGEIAVYKDRAFILDKKKDMTTFAAYYTGVTISGATGYVRAIFSGNATDLKVESAAIYSGSSTVFLDPETCTAAFNSGMITDYDLKNYQVRGNPGTTLTFEYDGETLSRSGGYSTSIIAPLQYIEVSNSPVESIIGVVPIIMITGIIVSIIALLITRRL